jgi:Microtubule-binding stalk of dynein motor
MQVIEAIRKKYTSDASFTPEVAKKASSAAEGMCKWVHAMDKYEAVAKVVAPKQAKLQEAEAQYQEVMVGLRTLQADLQLLMDKLATMEAELAHNTGMHPLSLPIQHVCRASLHVFTDEHANHDHPDSDGGAACSARLCTRTGCTGALA